jgi:hypothetical protein
MTRERTFQQLAATYSPEVRRLAADARAAVRRLLPDVEERVDASGPYVGYGYGPGYQGLVCTLILSKSGVKLGIVEGAAMADPHHLLEGSGKRHRHIALKTPADLERRGVADLVRSAHRAWRERQ